VKNSVKRMVRLVLYWYRRYCPFLSFLLEAEACLPARVLRWDIGMALTGSACTGQIPGGREVLIGNGGVYFLG